MIVTAEQTFGSIGGGNLEYTAIQQARDWLLESSLPAQKYQPFGLGPALNQCCGGAVVVHFERFSDSCPQWVKTLAADRKSPVQNILVMGIDSAEPTRSLVSKADSAPTELPSEVFNAAQKMLHACPDDQLHSYGEQEVTELEVEGAKWWLQLMLEARHPLVLFGAGYVGHEVAGLLTGLPFEVTWVDSRPDAFPATQSSNICMRLSENPVAEVTSAKQGSIFVVMTHSHQLDEDICFEIMRHNDFAWLGLIGSETKQRRFVQRLNRRGIDQATLSRLVCPIGLAGISGKQPATIALSLAAQLMMDKPWIHANN
jgi:xanthine dehydrogenase accessory factor